MAPGLDLIGTAGPVGWGSHTSPTQWARLRQVRVRVEGGFWLEFMIMSRLCGVRVRVRVGEMVAKLD